MSKETSIRVVVILFGERRVVTLPKVVAFPEYLTASGAPGVSQVYQAYRAYQAYRVTNQSAVSESGLGISLR